MRLQLTLDALRLEDCLDLILDTRDYVDVVEVGYPLLVEEGLSMVRHVKHAFPDKVVLADAKVFHSGGYIAQKCFDYGADAVSVLGLASNQTFDAVLRVAEGRGRRVVGDLAGMASPLSRAAELEALGVGEFVVPSGLGADGHELSAVSDLGEAGAFAPLELLRGLNECLTSARSAVVGHIGLDNIAQVAAARPDCVLVGRAIAQADDPRAAASRLKAQMK